MTMTMVLIAMAVLFTAYLAGKILMEVFPDSGFGKRRGAIAKGDEPAE